MSTLTRWDPFRELEDMHNRLSTFFNRSPGRRGDGKETMTVADWSPAVDISEDDKAYVFKAELPDLKHDQIKVTVEHGVLTISGERKFEKEDKSRKYHRIERAYGSFVRSFMLPDNADADKITATHKDGLLTVSIAKSEQARPRQVEIKVA